MAINWGGEQSGFFFFMIASYPLGLNLQVEESVCYNCNLNPTRALEAFSIEPRVCDISQMLSIARFEFNTSTPKPILSKPNNH